MNRLELDRLVTNYRPNPEALRQQGRVALLMTVGASNSGKSTLMRASGILRVIGDCSRPPRPGERNGVDYYFRTLDEMVQDAKAGKYAQIALGPAGDLKGTRASSYPAEGMATIAVVPSGVQTFRELPFERTETAIIVPESYDVWMKRAAAREQDKGEAAIDYRQFASWFEFALQDSEAQFVLNDTVEAGTARLLQVAAGKKPDDADQARRIAEEILDRLAA